MCAEGGRESGDDTPRAQIERAERSLADCKQRLERYRAALEAGTDPAVIAQWSAEAQAEQARAETTLRIGSAHPRALRQPSRPNATECSHSGLRPDQ